MANSLNLATLVTLAVAATLLGHTVATTYTVGGSVGWTSPPNKTFYETWASQYTFIVGDVLVFNFTSGQHTVAPVTKESFEECDLRTVSLIESGPASITLNVTGVRYYVCTVAQHCSLGGQKVAINVTASTASPSPSTTPPALGPGGPDDVIPSPPPSGTERSSLAKIFTVFISAAVCLLL